MRVILEIKNYRDRSLGNYSLTRNITSIGRSKSCDIVTPEVYSTVSGRHVSIKNDQGLIQVLDGCGGKGSTNGTFVNGERVQAGQWEVIQEGDTITLGRYGSDKSLYFSYSIEEESNPTLAGTNNINTNNINIGFNSPQSTREPGESLSNFITNIVLIILVIILAAAFGADEGTLIVLITGIIVLEIYFLPATIAFCRSIPNKYSIFALNLFLGWTLIGWVASLVWSLSSR